MLILSIKKKPSKQKANYLSLGKKARGRRLPLHGWPGVLLRLARLRLAISPVLINAHYFKNIPNKLFY